MPYRFATEDRDYSDYASGRVFYSAPGHPAFPVRLTDELFQRCQAARRRLGLEGPLNLYDPCCGGAYHLSTLAYLHWDEIAAMRASDIDEQILPVAARNLGLLTSAGLEKRAAEISALLEQFGKPSHAAALESAGRFRQLLDENLKKHAIDRQCFAADATDGQALVAGLKGYRVDLVLADVPYGWRSEWRGALREAAPGESLLEHLLEALLSVISGDSLVAIVTDKAQNCAHPRYQRLGRFKVGKREATLLRPVVTT
jgi:hypothetical protein